MDEITPDGGPIGEALRLRCACGWETTGSEDEIVMATQDHGRRLHNMRPTRAEVLAMVAASAAAAEDHATES